MKHRLLPISQKGILSFLFLLLATGGSAFGAGGTPFELEVRDSVKFVGDEGGKRQVVFDIRVKQLQSDAREKIALDIEPIEGNPEHWEYRLSRARVSLTPHEMDDTDHVYLSVRARDGEASRPLENETLRLRIKGKGEQATLEGEETSLEDDQISREGNRAAKAGYLASQDLGRASGNPGQASRNPDQAARNPGQAAQALGQASRALGQPSQEVVVLVVMNSYETGIIRTEFDDTTKSRTTQLINCGSGEYALTLVNQGRKPDSVRVSVAMPFGWTATVADEAGEAREIFNVPPSTNLAGIDYLRQAGQTRILVDVLPPAWAPKWTQADIKVRISSVYGAPAMADTRTELGLTAIKGGTLVASSAQGSPNAHPHLLSAGAATTYVLQVTNTTSESQSYDLVSEGDLPAGWSSHFSPEKVLELLPGATSEVTLTLQAPFSANIGDRAALTATARDAHGVEDSIDVEAQITHLRKVYFFAVDAMSERYLELDAQGTGLGSEGDWLLPNIRAFMRDEAFSYSNARCNLPSATDMNHVNALSGTTTGFSGVDSVSAFYYGRDANGRLVLNDGSRDILRAGPDGDPVLTLFDVAADPSRGGDSDAYSAIVTGKNWVGELLRSENFKPDLIVHGQSLPFYVEQPKPYVLGDPESDVDADDDPPSPLNLGPFDIGSFVGSKPGNFPDDRWVATNAKRLIENEDPDVLYILLAHMDDAQHLMGAAWDLEEWNVHDPSTTWDDVSKVNRLAAREEVLDVMREVDALFGDFVQFLKDRGTFEDSYIVIEADHTQVTHYQKGVDYLEALEENGYSSKKDFAALSASSMAAFFDMSDETAHDVESILEANALAYDRISGKLTSAYLVVDREEALDGIEEEDILPGELYSEYYISHQPADPHDNSINRWPSLLVFARDRFQFPIVELSLANLGITLPVPIPEMALFVGGHGGMDTRHIPIIMHGPGILKGGETTARALNSDITPTFYQLLGLTPPWMSQGRVLDEALE